MTELYGNIIPDYEALSELHNMYNGNIVLTNGCFDLFHSCHLDFLKQCTEFVEDNQCLLVAINSDESVKSLKGNTRPIIPFKDRSYIVSCLRGVDYVVELKEKTMVKIFDIVNPKKWIKGGDYTIDNIDRGEKDVLERIGTEIIFTGVSVGLGTTDIINKILKVNYKNK